MSKVLQVVEGYVDRGVISVYAERDMPLQDEPDFHKYFDCIVDTIELVAGNPDNWINGGCKKIRVTVEEIT